MASRFVLRASPLRVDFVLRASDHLWLGEETKLRLVFVNRPAREVYGGKQRRQQRHTCVGLGIYQVTFL